MGTGDLAARAVGFSVQPSPVSVSLPCVIMVESNDCERDLVRRLRRRDADVFPQLYDLLGDRLYAFVFNLVDRDHGVAEDIVQDVWLTALRGVDRYEGRGRLYTWLCGIALHKVQDHWRRVGRDSERRYRSPGEAETDETLDLIDTEPLPEEIVEREETRQLVREAVSFLPDHYRTVLHLKYVEQLSAQEIALLLNKSPKAVESSLCRARLALRDCMRRRMGE